MGKTPAMQGHKSSQEERDGPKPGVKRGCDPAPALPLKGDLQACLDDNRHRDTKKVKEKSDNLEDWNPIRPSAEGCPPKGDLLIGARSCKVGLEMKASMRERG